MSRRSAGILLYRDDEVLLVHPGGPFWAKKDAGAWSIPKGEYEPGDDPRACALREFEEELGTALPAGTELAELGDVRQKSGKVITAYAAAGDLDADAITSNTFTVEWPPRSGRMQEFPEADRAGWFSSDEALAKVTKGQVPIVRRLLEMLGG